MWMMLAAAVLHVAPPASGPIDLNALRDEARARHATLPRGETVEIVFAPGVYEVAQTLALYKADSHTVWRAARPGSVHWRGGRTVPPSVWRDEVAQGVALRAAAWSALGLMDVAVWPDDFRVPPGPWLYRNGRPLPVARYPNGTNWLTFASTAVSAGEAAAAGSRAAADTIICTDARARTWDFDSGVWFYGYWCHDWSESFLRGRAFDPATGGLTFRGRHQYGLGGKTWGFSARRYCVVNARCELDAPGEWYLDHAARRLLLVPGANEKAATYVLATLTVPFVRADGVQACRFEGLTFAYAHANYAVRFDHVENVAVHRCTFANLGGTALQLTGRASLIDACRFSDIGKGCIVLGGGDRKQLRKSGLEVSHCRFTRWAHFQRTYTPAVFLGGCGHVVRDSLFRDAPHNAILFRGNDHLIERNEFDRVLTETGDAGAIYTGRDPSEMGTVIRQNYFHDLGDAANRPYTSAVYFDDCDWGDSVVSNRFERLGRGVLLGGGNLFRIEGNTFTDCLIGIHIDSRGLTWKQWTAHPDWFDRAFAPFMPFNAAWQGAYPDLARTLAETPAAPWNNILKGNRFQDCQRATQFDKGVLSVTNRMTILP